MLNISFMHFYFLIVTAWELWVEIYSGDPRPLSGPCFRSQKGGLCFLQPPQSEINRMQGPLNYVCLFSRHVHCFHTLQKRLVRSEKMNCHQIKRMDLCYLLPCYVSWLFLNFKVGPKKYSLLWPDRHGTSKYLTKVFYVELYSKDVPGI